MENRTIEERLVCIEQKVTTLVEQLKAADTLKAGVLEHERVSLHTELRLMAIELNIDKLFRRTDPLEEITSNMQKVDEVYYHVFPDRWQKDVRFEEQLRALNLPLDPSQAHKKP